MERISDRLSELIDRMKASDARLQALTEEFTTTAKRDLEKMQKLIEEE